MILPQHHAIKVLRGGASWHGGSHEWSLPRETSPDAWEPGEWTPLAAPRLCLSGWHLVSVPEAVPEWWSADPGVTAYLAEYRGLTDTRDSERKIAVESCRLLRPLATAELTECGIFTEGAHEARAAAQYFAYGSATVEAYGSATVRAYGSATVRAYDSATVEAYGSATVRAYGSATVHAAGSATVRAYDSATVHAAGQSTCVAWRGTTLVLTRADSGVIVDRRGPAPKTYCKRKGLDGWRYVDGKFVQRAPKVGP